jgi:hypothetical protein
VKTAQTFDALFVAGLGEIYDAEPQLVKIRAAPGQEMYDAQMAQLANPLRCETLNSG